jgi:hypothetical protein
METRRWNNLWRDVSMVLWVETHLSSSDKFNIATGQDNEGCLMSSDM